MVVKTQSPSVKVGLGAQQKLHCQFAVDHKGPDVTVEWHWQNRGERLRLFSHTSRSGQTQGSGVGLKSLAGGDASYALPFAKMSSEGLYVCSVSVTPLFASLDISLHIEGEECQARLSYWWSYFDPKNINEGLLTGFFGTAPHGLHQ